MIPSHKETIEDLLRHFWSKWRIKRISVETMEFKIGQILHITDRTYTYG